jgi:hypothetical protein
MKKHTVEEIARELAVLEADAREFGRRWREWNRKPTGVGPPESCRVCGGAGELVCVADGKLGPCLPCGGSGRDGLGAVWDPYGHGSWC